VQQLWPWIVLAAIICIPMSSILVELGGTSRKIGFAIAILFVGTVLGFWGWWAFWGNHAANSGTPDHWLDVMTGFGAAVTGAGVVVGAVFAVRYGRKATVSLSADTVNVPGGNILVRVRPCVQAVGIFRLRFSGTRGGAVVTVTEQWADDKGDLHNGRFWDEDWVFGPSFVEGGETLTTTAVFPIPDIPERVVGWRVAIAINLPRRAAIPSDPWTWADRVFVGRPEFQK